jgi:hypothetical protein
MSRKSYTETLQELKREIRISGFESRYLGILFGLLGISLPLLLSGNLIESNGFMSGIINIALVAYAPLLLISLIIYYFSGEFLFLKKLSVNLASAAGLFIILFVLLASLDYKTQILSKYSPYTVWGFFAVYFVAGIIIWFRVNNLINKAFLKE